MRKTLLLTFALLLSIASFAQNRAILLNETFDGIDIPEGWYIDSHADNWSISTSAKSGGQPNEICMNWAPEFNGTTRLVMPAFDFTDVSEVMVSFKHYHDNYIGENTIGIATSSDGGATWNIGWQQTYVEIAAFNENHTISTPDMGKSDVLMCIYFTGNSYLVNNWYFDDIEVFKQEELDLELVSIDVPNIIGTDYNDGISFTVRNTGLTTVTSFDVNLSLYYEDGYETYSFDTNLAPFESAQFTIESAFPQTIYFGYSHAIEIGVSKVNGENYNGSSGFLLKEVYLAMRESQKVVLLEHFTASTCDYPCIPINQIMDGHVNTYAGKCSYIKYPIDLPLLEDGSPGGDPYWTDESIMRKNYYAVMGVPETFVDAVSQGYAAATDEDILLALETPAYLDIKGSFTVEGNTIKVIADFMAYANIENVRAFIAVSEKTTKNNLGNDEETEYHHVMMKMVEDAEGNEIASITAGEYHRLELSCDLSETNVEEMDDLEVVMWLQNYDTKEVFNSNFAYGYTEHCNPVRNLTASIGGDDIQKLYLNWDEPEGRTPVAYNIYVDGELIEGNYDLDTFYSNEEIVESIIPMNYDEHIAEVVALFEDGMTSVGTVKVIDENWDNVEEFEDAIRFNVYPNPADDVVRLSTVNSQQTTVRIYNILGMLVEEIEIISNETEINVSDYNPGIYFFNIDGKTKKVVIN
ncbi:MAG: T9SS type A sorting domain-containing protein [Bacteroidales bacterium]|nr:T9SS type A sorting domain-containing protein [Bacteroidales bacterium]